MIEVVFSESAKGSMKVAKKYKKENIGNEIFTFFGESQIRIKFNEMYKGKSIGGESG